MVLQAFSWHELGDYYGATKEAYPSFDQSRLMAYDVIAHGAKGILFWGTPYLTSEEFRQSLYALTSELAALQPLLVAHDVPHVRIDAIEPEPPAASLGVRLTARNVGEDWLVMLVNEDDRTYARVKITGLEILDGRRLVLLYGKEEITIDSRGLATGIAPYEVKVFATGRQWETQRHEGRSFGRRDDFKGSEREKGTFYFFSCRSR
jgi:hypothetical protein